MVWRPPRWTHTHTHRQVTLVNQHHMSVANPIHTNSVYIALVSLPRFRNEMAWPRARVATIIHVLFWRCHLLHVAQRHKILSASFARYAWLSLAIHVFCLVCLMSYVLYRMCQSWFCLLYFAAKFVRCPFVVGLSGASCTGTDCECAFRRGRGEIENDNNFIHDMFLLQFFFVFVSCCECVVSPLVMQYALSLVGAGICDIVTRKAARFEAWCLTIANDGLMMHWIIAKYKTYWDSSNFHDWCQQTLLSMLCEYLSEC